MSLGNLIVTVGADIRDFVKNMNTVQTQLKRGIGPDALAMSQNLVKAFALVTAAAGAFGGASIVMAAKMEQSKIAFTTMLGSAQKAEIFLQELSDFAAVTPFEFPGLIEATKKMLAFGFTSEQLIPMLTSIGDAVSGLGGGSDLIDRVTIAIGQLAA